MAKRNWKRTYPHSLRQAMELCVEYAREKSNQSVEHACGIDFVTQYLAHSGGKMLIQIPTGKAAEHTDLNALSIASHEAVALLFKLHTGEAEAPAAIAAVTTLMEDLAYQRGNIEKNQQPELELA